MSDTPRQDLYVFTAHDQGEIIGGAVFSRLTYADDPPSVFILSPMAVAADRHGQGIGQGLLKHALAVLRDDGVDVAITHGDPALYGKVGFLPIDKDAAAAPLQLSFLDGWIGQSLTDKPFHALRGKCAFVAALDDPAIW